MTLAEMRASTKNQIINSIADYLQANLTRRQVIQLCRERDTEWDDPVSTYGADGQIESQNEIERDSETGAPVSRKYTTWTYYNNGNVNVIAVRVFDETDALVKQKIIKHYRDGRQPEEQ